MYTPAVLPAAKVQNGVVDGVVQLRPVVALVIAPNVAPVSVSLIVVADAVAPPLTVAVIVYVSVSPVFTVVPFAGLTLLLTVTAPTGLLVPHVAAVQLPALSVATFVTLPVVAVTVAV